MRRHSTLTPAQSLRRSTTGSEQRLWRALRDKRLVGTTFRRQHIVGPYVVDFFCKARDLAIEIDGGVHQDEDARLLGARRDAWMTERGITILRIPDQLVRQNLDTALSIIVRAASLR